MEQIEKEKTSRQLQAEATKEKLLDVSLQLVREQGFDNVKIEDICKAANVSTGAFYHHIKNKAGIVEAAYAKCDDYFLKIVHPQFETRTDVEAIGDYIGFQMKYATHFGVDLITQIYKAQLLEGTDFFLSVDRPLSAGLVVLVEKMQQANVIKKVKSAETISSEILIIARGILYHWCLMKGSPNIEVIGKQMIQQFISGYVY